MQSSVQFALSFLASSHGDTQEDKRKNNSFTFYVATFHYLITQKVNFSQESNEWYGKNIPCENFLSTDYTDYKKAILYFFVGELT
jgi:hypothetical protein